MITLFGRLFSPVTPPTDGLSQGQREAIVDLLYFCMCADQRLLPVENAAIADEVATFNWDPTIKFETFAAQSLQRAQLAVAAPKTRETMLLDIGNQLVTTETKTRAITLCPQIFRADGEYAPAERAVFVEIKRSFGWPD